VDNSAYIGHIVVRELIWALISGYGYTKDHVLCILEQLLRVAEFEIESPPLVWQAIGNYRKAGVDFADHLIALTVRTAGCTATFTFD
jgi:predicted nucleic-acid-binding protein